MRGRTMGVPKRLACALVGFALSACECGPVPCKTQATGTGDAEEVCIPGGWFAMGHEKLPKAWPPDGGYLGGVWPQPMNDWAPVHDVKLSPYFIDKHEVTWARYRECMEARICGNSVSPSNYDEPHEQRHPARATYEDALKFCTWIGKRLPTEAEWEHAARGPKGFDYPWGNTPPSDSTRQRAKNRDWPIREWTIGIDPADVSPYGVFDMYGGAREWVSDWYDPFYYSKSPRENPQGPPGPVFIDQAHEYNEGNVILTYQYTGSRSTRSHGDAWKGGNDWDEAVLGAPVWFRDQEQPEAPQGFRCARDDRSPLVPPPSGIWEYRGLEWRSIPEAPK